jgi:hypothetical protein
MLLYFMVAMTVPNIKMLTAFIANVYILFFKLLIIILTRVSYYYYYAEYKKQTKQTQWPESASELYRPSDRLLSAKLAPTFGSAGNRTRTSGSVARNSDH